MSEKNQQNSKMTSIQNIILRVSIVLGMVAAVVTILYFTPMPDQNFKSCDRPCHALDWPMICRVKLHLEMHQTSKSVCKDCLLNTSQCTNEHCTSDGSPKSIITVNGLMPGPAIQVCQNDILVIDVVNKIPGHSLSLHWRGQRNDEAPYMDGVPMVTQCPITSYTTFQYKFRASSAGTHFYHAYSDSDRSNGVFGALIVRQADKQEPHRKLYDLDEKTHVILVSEWLESNNEPKALLINGKMSFEPVFHVQKSKRYRFRVANVGGSLACPVTFSIDGHIMKIIALDGNPTNPYEASSVVLGKGERFDFILKTNQEIANYYIRVKSNCRNYTIKGFAVINYEGSIKDSRGKLEKIRNFDTAMCFSKIGEVCLRDVRSLQKMPTDLRDKEVKRTIFLVFDSKLAKNGDPHSKIYRTNNLTFTYPSSPLLTQLNDISHNTICNELNIPEKCKGKEVCECVHVEYIPLGVTTEFFLINKGVDDEEEIFHLHGYKFYVIAYSQFNHPPTLEEIKEMEQKDELKRNLNSPILKDTLRIPRNSVAVVRFLANNPGFWILRDEKSKGWTRGLDIVFQIGDISDMISTPSNFPTCGSFIGPDFFLM